jgi:DNA-binding beta-propeller fold protein YncE
MQDGTLARAAICMSVAAVVALHGGGASAQTPRHTSPIQVTGDGSSVWVVNPDSDSVAKIDASSDTLLGEYPVGDFPRTLAIDAAGGSVYVVNQGSQDLTPKPNPDTVMRLAQADGAVLGTVQLPFGCAPYGVVVNENGASGTEVYVTCERRQEVVVLNASLDNLLATVALDWPDPRGMAISADRSRIYVAHFLTREPGSTAHVSEIDTTQSPPRVVRVLGVPPDTTTCETINSGTGVLNLLMGIHLTPPGSPAAVANQLWVGGVNQNNLTKGLFKRDRRFGGHAEPLLCAGGANGGQPCRSDDDCTGGQCAESFIAQSRNLYKASFHDITRFQIAKIDLGTGQVVGKIDVDEANQASDLDISADGVSFSEGDTAARIPSISSSTAFICSTARAARAVIRPRCSPLRRVSGRAAAIRANHARADRS